MKTKAFFFLIVIAAAGLSFFTAAPAAAQPCSAPYGIVQTFPSGGPEQTRWEICWQMDEKYGLIITYAAFRPSPAGRLIQVLFEGRIAELYVGYDDGGEYFDIMGTTHSYLRLSTAECPPTVGQILNTNQVCRQLSDRGLAWRVRYPGSDRVRRGESLMLWGILHVGNYMYVIEWTFRDDGMLEGRVGATGQNLPTKVRTGHVHNVTWRLDVDLDGASGDTVYTETWRRLFGRTARHDIAAWGREGGDTWIPEQFKGWQVGDSSLRNSRGTPSVYHLMPLRFGNQRHIHAYLQRDFWATRYRWTELDPRYLPQYISPGEWVNNADVVLWYTSGFYHHPRPEDGVYYSGQQGATPLMWAGISLKPWGLFDGTPLYP
jgi:primary-amine oxidase